MTRTKNPDRRPAPGPARGHRPAGRRLAAVAGLALTMFLVLLACATLGDPLSRAYSTRHAVDYANETWPGHDFYIVDVQFYPFWRYTVGLQAADSIDTHFTVEVSTGIVRRTGYEQWVASLQNTRQRLHDSLHSDVQAALDAAGYAPVGGSDFVVTVGDPAYGSCPAQDHTFTLDMPYDKGDIPPQTTLWVNGWSDAPDSMQGNAILRKLYSIMTGAGIDIDEYAVTLYDAGDAAGSAADTQDDTYESGWVTAGELAAAQP